MSDGKNDQKCQFKIGAFIGCFMLAIQIGFFSAQAYGSNNQILSEEEQRIKFDIHLIEIKNVQKYPLTTYFGLFASVSESESPNFKKVVFTEENIDDLNANHFIANKDLKLELDYLLVPGPESLVEFNNNDSVYYCINLGFCVRDLSSVYVRVKTDACCASTISDHTPMKLIQEMVKDANITSRTFILEDEDVYYTFEIRRSEVAGVCTAEGCSSP